MRSITLLLLLITIHCSAQTHAKKTKEPKKIPIYLRVGGGYGFAKAGEIYGVYGAYSGTATYTNDGSVSQFSHQKVSFGKGVYGQAAIGLMLSKNVGLDLALNMCLTKEQYQSYAYNVPSTSTSTYNSVTTLNAKGFKMLIPSIVLQTGSSPWNLYTRFGVVLPLSTRLERQRIVNYSTGDNITYNTEAVSKFSLGYSASLGVSYIVDKKIKIWFDCTDISLLVYPNTDELKSYSQNGVNIPLSSFNYTTIPLGLSGNSYTTPSTEATTSVPFSSIGLNFGMSFDLN